jgi:hypothetical protein
MTASTTSDTIEIVEPCRLSCVRDTAGRIIRGDETAPEDMFAPVGALPVACGRDIFTGELLPRRMGSLRIEGRV